MKAVILAAGLGSRLGSLTRSTPKCLLPINDQTILDYQISPLRDCGINDIYVVTGYRADKITTHLGDRCQTIFNARYQDTNSIYSLWLAREFIDGEDFILLNGDVVADEALIFDLVACPAPCAALIDNKKRLCDGEMNILLEDQKIIAFSKTVKACDAHGESVQITKFGKRESRLLFGRIDQLVANGETNNFPAFAYDIIFQQSQMSPVFTQERRHFEIDTPDDYHECLQALAR